MIKKISQKGFSVAFLDLLFVLIGILILIYGILSNKETFRFIISVFKK